MTRVRTEARRISLRNVVVALVLLGGAIWGANWFVYGNEVGTNGWIHLLVRLVGLFVVAAACNSAWRLARGSRLAPALAVFAACFGALVLALCTVDAPDQSAARTETRLVLEEVAVVECTSALQCAELAEQRFSGDVAVPTAPGVQFTGGHATNHPLAGNQNWLATMEFRDSSNVLTASVIVSFDPRRPHPTSEFVDRNGALECDRYGGTTVISASRRRFCLTGEDGVVTSAYLDPQDVLYVALASSGDPSEPMDLQTGEGWMSTLVDSYE